MIRYLGISLEKLMTMDILKEARVLAGLSGITNRVAKVNVMEVPDILEWVSDGELLLTTAYSIKDNINVLLDLIPKLKNKGVAGIGIKMGRYIQELPVEIIGLADRLGFPIIEIPYNVSHTDMISSVLTEVINNNMNILLLIENFNTEVMNIMIKGGGLKEIARKLYDSIGSPLAIYENLNGNYELICDDTRDRGLYAGILHDHTGVRQDGGGDSPDKYVTCSDDIGGRTVERVMVPIVIENIEYGSIFIWQDRKPLTHIDSMLVESYVHIIALEFVKKLALYNMESNYKLDFFDDLLSQSRARQNRAMEKAKTFGFRKDLKHTVIIIHLKELYSMDRFTYKKVNFAKECMSAVLFTVNRMAKLNEENIIYVEKSDRILVLYGSDPAKNDKAIKADTLAFCGRILDSLKEKSVADQLVIGAGRCYEGVERLWKSHEQAKLIVENLKLSNRSNIIHYDDLGLYRIFSFDGLQNELVEFYTATVKPLVEYDKNNNSELVKTLKFYFLYNGNMRKMSEQMHMHYNTIIYRLQKIKELLGIDIEESDTRLNFEIALKIMDIIQP